MKLIYKVFSIVSIFVFQPFIFAQIDVDSIRNKVIENPKTNYYPLLEIFKINPSQLTQEELNQLYYGSKFANPSDSKAKLDKTYEIIFPKAQNKISKSKAENFLKEAEIYYKTSPMDKSVLKGMINIYAALGNEDKFQLAQRQLDLTSNTIEQSGNGKSEETAICVIHPSDQLSMIFRIKRDSDFNQEIKQLSSNSILWIYSSGNEKLYVKLVGGYY